ncbi:hypothetical protein [Microbacterium sp. USTB-Y]|uniref:hypothetical protein n=1 Tax=Microbacterium sp. USTB-Y TaxID=2823692 RepID=UPI002557D168|nr:hypothetical protein [Microbacterium sp. USTB-Y]
MTEPTDQPPAGPRAAPAAATRREARLHREEQTAQPSPGPLLAAPLTVPPAKPGSPLPVPLPLPSAAPIEPAATAPPRRRTALWISGAAVLLCLALGAIGLWFLRTPDGPAAIGQDISAPAAPNPLVERGLENGGPPAPAVTSAPATPPATSAPPVPAVASPAPGTPSADEGPVASPTQAPPAPAPVPAVSSPDPAPPAPTPVPPAPAPLAFTGIVANQTVNLLGIRILSSYTLMLSGQPGSTAAVTYGGAAAGSVTFDAAGRASITLGAGAIDLGIGNPIITAVYTDGTPGAPIQARRDAI